MYVFACIHLQICRQHLLYMYSMIISCMCMCIHPKVCFAFRFVFVLCLCVSNLIFCLCHVDWLVIIYLFSVLNFIRNAETATANILQNTNICAPAWRWMWRLSLRLKDYFSMKLKLAASATWRFNSSYVVESLAGCIYNHCLVLEVWEVAVWTFTVVSRCAELS